MQNEARSYAINMIDKAYNDTSAIVDALAKEPENMKENMRLLRLKFNNLGLYINTLKNLDTQQGGRRTRRNRRKSNR